MNNLRKGTYILTVSDKSGQQVFTKKIEHNGGSANQTLELNNIANGTYQLQLVGEGSKFIQQVVKF